MGLSTDQENLAASQELKVFFNSLIDRSNQEAKLHYHAYLQDLSQTLDSFDFEKSCTECRRVCSQFAKICKYCKAPIVSRSEANQFLISEVQKLRKEVGELCEIELCAPSFDHVQVDPSLAQDFNNDQPIFALPNSYKSCVQILRELGRRCEVKRYGGQQNFAVLACDGQPYSIITNLIKNHIKCGGCNRDFYGEPSFSKHLCPSKDLQLEFDWVYLQMGFGHLEMNLMKAIVSKFWESHFSLIAWAMNFRSKNALENAKRGGDTHKNYDFCNILRLSLMLELMADYLKRAVEEPSFRDFKRHVEKSERPNIKDSWLMLKDVLQPLFTFRAGVRRNNSTLISAGLKLSLPMFFAANRKKYQGIVTHYLVTRHLLSGRVVHNLNQTQVIMSNGVGEGLDFRLEEMNRRTKMLLPSNPTEQDWSRVYAQLDDIDDFRQSTFNDLGIPDNRGSHNQRKSDYRQQVEKIRATIQGKSLFTCAALTNIKGEPRKESVEMVVMTGQRMLQTNINSGTHLEEEDDSESESEIDSENEAEF